jgi:alpha-ketoglutarate-dependent taurine dioxygenase
MPQIDAPNPTRPYVLIEAIGRETALDIDAAQIEALFKLHGALLLRGFGADVAQFSDFARKFCSTAVINDSPGRMPIDDANNIRTVDGGVQAFNLHAELAREPWKPDAAFFACLSPPMRGGATTICDGVALVDALPADVRAALSGRRLLHIMRTWPELLDFWLGTPTPDDALLASPPPDCPYAFRRLDGQIVRFFSRPAFHTPMFTEKKAFGSFLLFARFNNGRPDFPVLDDGLPVPEEWLQALKAAGDALSVEIAWQRGDILMLDNSRFLHGRTAIVDAGERLIASYFGFLRFAQPSSEEPPDPQWRRADFRPPSPPGWVT